MATLPPTRDSEQPPANPLGGTEIVRISQTVASVLTSVRTTISAIGNYLRSALGVWSAT